MYMRSRAARRGKSVKIIDNVIRPATMANVGFRTRTGPLSLAERTNRKNVFRNSRVRHAPTARDAAKINGAEIAHGNLRVS